MQGLSFASPLPAPAIAVVLSVQHWVLAVTVLAAGPAFLAFPAGAELPGCF